MTTIGIDVDSTLASSDQNFIEAVRKKYGVTAQMEKMFDWNLELNPPLQFMTKEDTFKIFGEMWSDYKSIKLEDPKIPQIMESLSKKFTIYVVTASAGGSKNIESWLKFNGLKFNKYFHVKRSIDKVNTGADIYIDDYQKVVKLASDMGKRAILLSKPWNREFAKENKDPNIRIAASWQEIERMLLNGN